MRLRLKPRDNSLLDLLSALAATLPPAADLLGQALGSPASARATAAERLKEAEHAADEATHAVLRRVNETFVTPFDRDDIYTLASCLDDCIDLIEEVADRSVLYRVATFPDAMVEQAQVIQRSAELTAEAITRLHNLNGLRDYWVEINSLENTGDRLHRQLLRSVFDGSSPAGTDPIEVMKLKELIDGLEAAIDAFERVANAVETIVLKEA